MAKRKQDETEEMPPVTVETVKEEPLKTTETVKIVPAEVVTSDGAIASGKRSSGSAGHEPVALPPGSEYTYILNDDTGEMRQVVARAGYAPTPMPFGFRLATADEVKKETPNG